MMEQTEAAPVEAENLPETTPDQGKEVAAAALDTVPTNSAYSDKTSFELTQRIAKAVGASDLVPAQFRGTQNLPNAMLALEMANRVGMSPLATMQNLYVVHGKPTWSAQFIVSVVNHSGRFSPIRYDMQGEGNTRSCTAYATDLVTGEKLEGVTVSMEMAHAEGWSKKAGSKWKTMPELMLRYRAATFFGRLYAPDLLLGMQTIEEMRDIEVSPTGEVTNITKGVRGLSDRMKQVNG